MKNLFQIISCVFATVLFTACEHKPREVTMAFYRDTVINGVKTEKVLKKGRVIELTNAQQDSIAEVLKDAVALTGRYLARTNWEDTLVYLDRLMEYWHEDSLGDKITKDQINKAVAIQFGQALVDNNNFEWKLLEGELLLEERQELGAELPNEISKAIIDKRDSLNLQGTKKRILRDIKIVRQLRTIEAK